MEKRINPFSDFGFKLIFGRKVTKEFLIDFLNSILKGERVITDLHYLDKEQVKRNVDDRSLIYDVYCETDNGENIIVEMQNHKQAYFKDRTLHYLARSISEQAKTGEDWEYKMTPVYCIALLNFKSDDMPKKFRTDVMLADIDTHEVFTKQARLVYLQLPYFNKREEECVTELDQWIYNLLHMERLEKLPFALQGNVFQKLDKVTNVASLSKEERREYEIAWKQYRDTMSVFAAERQDGIQEGIQKEKLQIARNLKAMGLSIEAIQQATNLSKEEIQAL
jgi:predicted transposase/invertase (TIGR01784 family)